MGRVNMAAARPTKNAEHKDANRTTLINRQTTIKQHTMYGLGRGRQDTYIRRPFVQMQAGVLAQLVFGRDLQAQDGRASNVLLPCVHEACNILLIVCNQGHCRQEQFFSNYACVLTTKFGDQRAIPVNCA